MPEPQNVNYPYWQQQALFNGGFQELMQEFRVYYNGPAGTMSCSMRMTDPNTEGWIDALVPIWVGELVDLQPMLRKMLQHMTGARTYLEPF